MNFWGVHICMDEIRLAFAFVVGLGGLVPVVRAWWRA